MVDHYYIYTYTPETCSNVDEGPHELTTGMETRLIHVTSCRTGFSCVTLPDDDRLLVVVAACDSSLRARLIGSNATDRRPLALRTERLLSVEAT